MLTYYGKQVVIDYPFKTYRYKLVKRKRRGYGRAYQRIRIFMGWGSIVEDGHIITFGDTLYMSEDTWRRLQEGIKIQET